MSSKALVIKNVSFATNKLTTVELSQGKPCTALSLSQNAATMTELLSTVTLTATTTPADTTDVVLWTSSDNAVASVVNGVITQNGIGSCTITATCGNVTATCDVTATCIYSTDELTVFHRLFATKADGETRDFITNASTSNRYQSFFADGNPLDGYKAISSADATYDNYYPIPFPNNAESVTLTFTGSTQQFTGIYITLVNADELRTYPVGNDALGARVYATVDGMFGGALTKTMEFPEHDDSVNGFVLSLLTKSGVDEATVTDDVTITFN